MSEPFETRGDHIELIAIEGEQLSAVTFVQDYVQLHFDGPMITAVTVPFVLVGKSRFNWDTPGYRDRLCSCIAKIVTRAYVKIGDRLQIDFPDELSIVVSLRREDYRGAEAVVFGDGPRAWAVW
jgi:hypothetical protein